MATASCSTIAGLPKMDADRANLGNAVLRLLAGGELSVAIVEKPAGNFHAFTVSDVCAFALPFAPYAPTELDHIFGGLDAADALLTHIETRLDIQLEPQAYVPLENSAFAHPDAVQIAISNGESGVWLALVPSNDTAAHWVDAAQTITQATGAVPVPVTLYCQAARLPVAAAAQISAGDLLLLPGGIAATLSCHCLPDQSGWFDTKSGQWQAGAFGDFEDDTMTDDENPTAAAFAVPITLRLPQQAVDSDQLAAIAPGMVLPLSPLSQGLSVELLVGGRLIARGEIVEMGAHFAVHIDESFSAKPAAPLAEEAA